MAGENLLGLPVQELYAGIQEILDAFGYHLGPLMASTMEPSAGIEGLLRRLAFSLRLCDAGGTKIPLSKAADGELKELPGY